MGLFTKFTLAIRRRETPFYDRLYGMAKAIRGFSMPCVPGFHNFLYAEWNKRTQIWHEFWRVMYYEPMFKARCRSVGKNFRLEYSGNGICRILGNLQVFIGDDVYTFDNISLSASRVYDAPELHVGSHAYVGPLSRIHVAKSVHIGAHTILGSRTFITDNSGHPANPALRLVPGGGLPDASRIAPVSIGDHCFLGLSCIVYPGAQVGDGVLAKAGTHIMGYVPPFAIVGGNPGKVSRLMYIPEEMRAIGGEEKYQSWLAEQEDYLKKYPDTKRAHYDS